MDLTGSQWVIVPLIMLAGAVEALGMIGVILYMLGSLFRPARRAGSSI